MRAEDAKRPVTPLDVSGGFDEETRQILTSRLRVVVVLVVVLHLAFVPVDYLRLATHFWPATALRFVACGSLVSLLALLRLRGVERWAVPVAALIVTSASVPILGVVLFAQGPSDPLYPTQIIAVVFVVMGIGLFFPMDARTTLLLAGIPVLMQVAVTARFPLVPNLPIIGASVMALVVSAVGAEVNFETRLREYQNRRAKDGLIAARSRFVAMLSHDIKTPLAIIMGFADIIRETLPNGSDLAEPVDTIEANAHLAMGLALNFLDADRIETGALEVKRVEASLNDVVRHAVQHQAARMRVRGVELRLDLCAELPRLHLDVPLMDRVIANLLSNAIKFSPKGGIVWITTAHRDGETHVSIRDQGPGIGADERATLFARYGRSPRRRTDSTGLGLYIVKTFVEAHGGTVGVDCPPDGGTIFDVSLPTAS